MKPSSWFESRTSDQSHKFFKYEKLGLPECPYIERWILDFRYFTIRLHHWWSSDDLRFPHDHPWWFLTLILKGAYLDVSPSGDSLLHTGKLAFRRATHQHSVCLLTQSAWTLLITGRESRQYGFWVNGKFRKRNKYFFEYGHHPCSP